MHNTYIYIYVYTCVLIYAYIDIGAHPRRRRRRALSAALEIHQRGGAVETWCSDLYGAIYQFTI